MDTRNLRDQWQSQIQMALDLMEAGALPDDMAVLRMAVGSGTTHEEVLTLGQVRGEIMVDLAKSVMRIGWSIARNPAALQFGEDKYQIRLLDGGWALCTMVWSKETEVEDDGRKGYVGTAAFRIGVPEGRSRLPVRVGSHTEGAGEEEEETGDASDVPLLSREEVLGAWLDVNAEPLAEEDAGQKEGAEAEGDTGEGTGPSESSEGSA